MNLLQDTPGLSSRQAHKAICKHVAAQDQEYLKHEQDARKDCLMADTMDPRTDVCLMFLNPHAVSPQEIALMQGMSKLHVPVIPVISKVRRCSTMNTLANMCMGYKVASGHGIRRTGMLKARVRLAQFTPTTPELPRTCQPVVCLLC